MVKLVPAPVRLELIVFVALLTVIVEAAAKLIEPPDRTMAPEAAPKVMLPESIAPLTVIVPAPRPAVAVPKLMMSVVVVVVETMVPVPRISPHVEPPDPSQVPPAVPNPAVVLF